MTQTKRVINDRADEAREDSLRWFPQFYDTGFDNNLAHLLLCIAGEVGEASNLAKKYLRGTMTYDDLMPKLLDEIVDVQTYLFNLMGFLRRYHFDSEPNASYIDWEAEYDRKRTFNEGRYGAGEQFVGRDHQAPDGGGPAVRGHVPDSLAEG